MPDDVNRQVLLASRPSSSPSTDGYQATGRTAMARTPNYKFERPRRSLGVNQAPDVSEPG